MFAKKEQELESIIQAVRLYSDDIGMKFGIEKCAMLIMKRGKAINDEKNRITPTRKKSKRPEKRKLTNTREYWK